MSELPEGRRGETQEGPDCSSAAHSKGKREHPVVAAKPRRGQRNRSSAMPSGVSENRSAVVAANSKRLRRKVSWQRKGHPAAESDSVTQW